MQRIYEVCERNSKNEPIPVYVDDLNGNRKPLDSGTRFTAEVDTVKIWDKRGEKPVQIDTKQLFVVASDIDAQPGNLTSMIRTGRAKAIAEQPKPVVAKK